MEIDRRRSCPPSDFRHRIRDLAHTRYRPLVNFGTSGGRRVIFVPSIVALVLALLVAVGVVGLLTIIARRASGSSADATRASAPLNLFWLCVIPFLPGLADQVPLVLLLAGPVRWVIGITAVGAVLFPFVPVRLRTAAQTIDLRPTWIFAAGLVVALLLGTWVSLKQGVGGDEPHYLVITQSLLGDGDLRIENQHQKEQYRSYFNNVLPMHYLRRGLDGVIYSIHAPGLPALLMPAFAIGGARGAIVFIGVLAALTGVAVFLIVRRFSGAPSAVFAWMSLALTTPFIFHSWLIYPETPAACLVAWAALWFVGRERVSWWRWVLRGAAIWYWPWLHAKFAVLLAVFVAAFVVQSAKRREWSAVPALIVPVGASVAGWLGLFYLLYGVADPTIAYGDSAAGDQLNWGNLPRGMLGLLFDQEYGLLFHAPIYLLVPLGLWWMLRSSGLAGLAVLTLALFAVFVSSTTRYYMWWGGSSVPARFLVPILPLGAIAIGVAMARLARPLKGVAWLLLFLSVAMTFVMVQQPASYMMFNDRDGTGRIAELIGGSAGLTVVLPSFLWADWTAQLPQLAVYLAGLAGGALAAGLAARTGRTAAVTAVAFALAVLATAGVAARVLIPAHRFAGTVAVSRAAMWTEAGKAALHGLDPGRLRSVSVEAAMRRWPIVLRPGAERDGDLSRAFGPLSLPPGGTSCGYGGRTGWSRRARCSPRSSRATLCSPARQPREIHREPRSCFRSHSTHRRSGSVQTRPGRWRPSIVWSFVRCRSPRARAATRPARPGPSSPSPAATAHGLSISTTSPSLKVACSGREAGQRGISRRARRREEAARAGSSGCGSRHRSRRDWLDETRPVAGPAGSSRSSTSTWRTAFRRCRCGCRSPAASGPVTSTRRALMRGCSDAASA